MYVLSYCVPLHTAHHSMSAAALECASRWARERPARHKTWSLIPWAQQWRPITRHILFVRGISPDPPHTQGNGIIQDVNTKSLGWWSGVGGVLEVACHSVPLITKPRSSLYVCDVFSGFGEVDCWFLDYRASAEKRHLKCSLFSFFSLSVVSDSLWPHGLQHARLPCPSLSLSLLKLMSIESLMPSNHLIFCCPLLLLPSIFLASRCFPTSWLFASDGQNIGASASASVLPMNSQGWFPLGLTGLITLLSKVSQESSTPQFKSINSLAFSFLHSPTLTSIHDHWKNHSLD